MAVPNTFAVQPSRFWDEDGDEERTEVVRTQTLDEQHSVSDVWRLTGPELVALVDAITESDAWQRAVRAAGGETWNPPER
jgi:hypothetical protein